MEKFGFSKSDLLTGLEVKEKEEGGKYIKTKSKRRKSKKSKKRKSKKSRKRKSKKRRKTGRI